MTDKTIQLIVCAITFLLFTLGMTWLLTRHVTNQSSLAKIPNVQVRE